MYEAFKADAGHAGCFFTEGALVGPGYVHDQTLMVVSYGDTVIHITKQQAMEFFGLIEPTVYTQPITNAGINEAILGQPTVIDWDILYLEDENGTVVKHAQYEGATRQDAVAAFRTDYGNIKYIVSVTEHIEDDTNCNT